MRAFSPHRWTEPSLLRPFWLGLLGFAFALSGAEKAAEKTAGLAAATNAPSKSSKGAPIPKIVRGPYLQLGTPSNIVVRWRTDISGPSKVRYGTNLYDIKLKGEANGETMEHIVQLTNLKAGTTYFYLIETNPPPGTTKTNPAKTNNVVAATSDHGTNVVTSNSVAKVSSKIMGNARWHFTTAPPVGSRNPFRVWVLGDPGTKKAGQLAVRDAYYKFTGIQATDLWLMLGDNAYTAGKDKEYQESVFSIYHDMFRKSVLWPALGNHDGGSANSATQSGVYYDIFTLPTMGQAGGVMSGTEAYYSFEYANAHFICLDSHDSDRGTNGAMARWLRQDLAANRQDWTIAYFHHPPYTKGSHDSDNEKDSDGRMRDMRQNILPILESGGVDLVLAGHSHVYERSFPLKGHYGKANTFLPVMKMDSGHGSPERGTAYRKTGGGAIYIVAGSSGQTNKPAAKTNVTDKAKTNLVARIVQTNVPASAAATDNSRLSSKIISRSQSQTADSGSKRKIKTDAKGIYRAMDEAEDEEIDDEKLKPPDKTATEKGRLNHPAMCVSTNVLGSLILDIQGLRLNSTFINDKGEIIDRFAIIKNRTSLGP